MHSKYYVIPIFDNSINIKDCDNSFISLNEYTAKYLPKLYKLEDERIGTIWSGDGCAPLTIKQNNMIALIENEKKILANEMHVPLFLLATLDSDGNVYEVVTKQKIYYDYDNQLSIRECSKSFFREKYNYGYELYVKNFFNRKSFKLIEFPMQKVLKK